MKFVEDEQRGWKKKKGEQEEWIENARWRRLSLRRDRLVCSIAVSPGNRAKRTRRRWGNHVHDERKSAAKVATDSIPDSWKLEGAANTTLLISRIKGKQSVRTQNHVLSPNIFRFSCPFFLPSFLYLYNDPQRYSKLKHFARVHRNTNVYNDIRFALFKQTSCNFCVHALSGFFQIV